MSDDLQIYVNIATGFTLIPLAITLIEPKRERPGAEKPFKQILEIVKYCFVHPKIRSVLVYFSVLMSTGITGVWSYYMYYGELGLSVGYYEILFAVFGLCSGYGAKKAHALESRLGSGTSLYLPLSISFAFTLLGQIKHEYDRKSLICDPLPDFWKACERLSLIFCVYSVGHLFPNRRLGKLDAVTPTQSSLTDFTPIPRTQHNKRTEIGSTELSMVTLTN